MPDLTLPAQEGRALHTRHTEFQFIWFFRNQWSSGLLTASIGRICEIQLLQLIPGT